jgi:3-hydroxyacyl-CoA dehydrogenase
MAKSCSCGLTWMMGLASTTRRSTRWGLGVRDGIVEALEKGEVDADVKAMVMIGAGRGFIAGADIRQLGKPRAMPKRPVNDVLDSGTKPVVAAIHGYALGGGLEIALACHYRIAVPGAKVGLPEVLIGMLPGGGGTQRLPRLIGPKAAMEMIVSGRHVPAAEAKKLGIIDAIVEGGDVRKEAIAYARSVADRWPLPRVRRRSRMSARPRFAAMPFSWAVRAIEGELSTRLADSPHVRLGFSCCRGRATGCTASSLDETAQPAPAASLALLGFRNDGV